MFTSPDEISGTSLPFVCGLQITRLMVSAAESPNLRHTRRQALATAFCTKPGPMGRQGGQWELSFRHIFYPVFSRKSSKIDPRTHRDMCNLPLSSGGRLDRLIETRKLHDRGSFNVPPRRTQDEHHTHRSGHSVFSCCGRGCRRIRTLVSLG